MQKPVITTKDIALLRQLHVEGQLELAAEFQRNAVWPRPAKAYLIDTILSGKPIPLLFFQRTSSAHTGRSQYRVVDGQQRLRAIFEFLDGKVRLTESKDPAFKGKLFTQLPDAAKLAVLQYDLPVLELTGYSDPDIIDTFVRMNKYVVKLTPQEIRHAKSKGKFANFVNSLGKHPFWKDNRVFSAKQIARYKAVEFCAELTILLQEGPQDKKHAIDLYYQKYSETLPFESDTKTRLNEFLKWIGTAIPDLGRSRFRKPTDLYSLVGALQAFEPPGKSPKPAEAKARLGDFERQLSLKKPSEQASRYLVAASQQTDNLRPRRTRIEILASVIKGA